MATLAQLQEWRDRLMDAKFSGVLIVTDSSGDSVRYRSHSELGAALASLDSEIRNLTGGQRPSTIHFATSKGL
jgi:hypothetical protein